MENEKIIIAPLLKAKAKFDEAMGLKNVGQDDLYRDACIQRFEYCYELAWKTIKRFLQLKEIEVHGSKETFRQAAVVGYIDDPEKWFEFIDMSNLTVHTYNKEVADQIFGNLKVFQAELDKLVTNLKKQQ